MSMLRAGIVVGLGKVMLMNAEAFDPFMYVNKISSLLACVW
jgi:hypothetical protein